MAMLGLTQLRTLKGERAVKNTHNANARRVRRLIASFLCFCLVLVTSFITPHPIHAAAESGEAARAKVKNLAAKYTHAMNEISKVANMNLSSKAELHSALEILRRNDPDLKYLTYRLIEIALENPALQKSAEDKLRAYLAASPTVQDKIKKASPRPGDKLRIDATEEIQAWLKQLRSNPNVVRDWAGASQVEQEIKSQIARDKESLRRVAANIKRGVEDSKKKTSFIGEIEKSDKRLRPVFGFTEPVNSNALISPVNPQVVDFIAAMIVMAVIFVAEVAVLIVCNLISWQSCIVAVSDLNKNLHSDDVDLHLLPDPRYEKCKAECDKWRDDCIALARRVGNEDDEAMCWYRYYDDCLWSSCERLR